MYEQFRNQVLTHSSFRVLTNEDTLVAWGPPAPRVAKSTVGGLKVLVVGWVLALPWALAPANCSRAGQTLAPAGGGVAAAL